MKRIVGICGVARSGKDSLFKIIKSSLDSQGINCLRISIADSLRQELSEFLHKQLGISPWTECHSEKEIIREVLVSWSRVRRSLDKDYWIKRINSQLQDGYNIITDVRYENEIEYIKRLDGKCIFVERLIDNEGTPLRPPNNEELINTVPLKDICNSTLTWNNLDNYTHDQLIDIAKNQLSVLFNNNNPYSI